MSKSELKKYLKGLDKKQLQEQIVDLYDRFKPVKTYYDFAFNPKEDKLVEDAKFRIGKEYFPQGRRKPKMRRSIAQKLIKHFTTLGMAPHLLIDVMLFNIEIAQAFTIEKTIKQEAFYKSMLLSFKNALLYAESQGLFAENKYRIEAIVEKSESLNWPNHTDFAYIFESSVMNTE